MAKREAQAHLLPALAGMPTQEELNLAGAGAPRSVPTGSAVERAEQALAERVEVFTEASEALRAEIRSFAAVVAEAEGRPAEPGLRLVVSRETAEFEAIEKRGHSAPAQPATAVTSPASPARARNPARERLYADIGGAIIGLAGALALINFVLLK